MQNTCNNELFEYIITKMEHDVGMQLYIWQCHIYVYIEQCTV